jgi:hypothetical protein
MAIWLIRAGSHGECEHEINADKYMYFDTTCDT